MTLLSDLARAKATFQARTLEMIITEGREPMTDTEQAYLDAITALNSAAYAALRAAKDTTALPMVDRSTLRAVARMTDELFEDGTGENRT